MTETEFKITHVLKLHGMHYEIEVDPFYIDTEEYKNLPKHKYFVEYENPYLIKEVNEKEFEDIKRERRVY